MQIAKPGEMAEFYDWRFRLKEGDVVDYQSPQGQWTQRKINGVKEFTCEEEPDKTFKELQLETDKIVEGEKCSELISLTDCRVQKKNTIL